MELKKKPSRRQGMDLWEIDNGFTLQYLELTPEEALELYNLLDKELAVVTNTPTMTRCASEYANLGNRDGKLMAIKQVRSYNTCTLKEAKKCVEQYMSDNAINPV